MKNLKYYKRCQPSIFGGWFFIAQKQWNIMHDCDFTISYTSGKHIVKRTKQTKGDTHGEINDT
ncbi:hypothetical protein Selli1_33240 [Sellimonas catena]|uniref:Uncharacterized protein n=1 Tax=Sellimonas catena TaxID=2994035 RepID=A0A9W6CBH8_9FIRM|nr:hypothetical protein Selli1_33240 [Sellimonas catena]